MRWAALFAGALLVVSAGAPGRADEPRPITTGAVTWRAEGLRHLPRLLAQATRAKQRLLVGLSGGAG